MRGKLTALFVGVVLLSTSGADAQMRITEWMYNGATLPGNTGEFVELTNVGASSVDMTGWSFDDDGRVPGSQPLGTFGVVAPHESVVLTDLSEPNFRTAWGLPASVKIIGLNTNNLGRNDEINIYDSLSNLVDRLTYGDQNFPATIRTAAVSGNPASFAALGANTPGQWVFSANGDSYGSHIATTTDVGNPGVFTLVPEPSSLALAFFGGAFLFGCGLRKYAGSTT